MTSISVNENVSQLVEAAQKTSSGKAKRITDVDLRNIFIYIHPNLRFEAPALKWFREFMDSGSFGSISISDLIVKICEVAKDDHTLNCEHVAKGIFLAFDTNEKKKNPFPSCFFGKSMTMIPIKQIKDILPKWANNYEKIQRERGYDLIYSKTRIFTIIQEKLQKRLGSGVVTAIHGCLHSLLCEIYLRSNDELETFFSSIPDIEEKDSKSDEKNDEKSSSQNEPIYCQIQQRYMSLVIASLTKICKTKTIHLCDAYMACLHNKLWPQLTEILFHD